MSPFFKYAIAAIAILASLAVIVQGFVALQNHADKGGYNRCVAEIKTDEAEHLIKSIGAVNDAFKELQVLEDELQDNPSNDIASPSMQSTLIKLRQRHPQPK